MGTVPLHRYHTVLFTQKPEKFPLAIVWPSILSLCLGWQSNEQTEGRKPVPTKEDISVSSKSHRDQFLDNWSLPSLSDGSSTYSVLELLPGKGLHTCNPLCTHKAETGAIVSLAGLHSEFQANLGYLASSDSIKRTTQTCRASPKGELVSAALREHQQKPKADLEPPASDRM